MQNELFGALSLAALQNASISPISKLKETLHVAKGPLISSMAAFKQFLSTLLGVELTFVQHKNPSMNFGSYKALKQTIESHRMTVKVLV